MTRPKPDASRLRRALAENHEERGREVQELLHARAPLIRGSYVVQRGRCGRPSCSCASGEGHERALLYISKGATHSSVYVPSGDRALVHERNEQYRRFRKAKTAIVRLDQRALELADALEEQLVDPYPVPGTPKAQGRAKGRTGKRTGLKPQ